jgi:hypothetical protein
MDLAEDVEEFQYPFLTQLYSCDLFRELELVQVLHQLLQPELFLLQPSMLILSPQEFKLLQVLSPLLDPQELLEELQEDSLEDQDQLDQLEVSEDLSTLDIQELEQEDSQELEEILILLPQEFKLDQELSLLQVHQPSDHSEYDRYLNHLISNN